MKKFIENALVFVSVMFLVWIALSFFDVICHNLDPNPTYAIWNFFTMLF